VLGCERVFCDQVLNRIGAEPTSSTIRKQYPRVLLALLAIPFCQHRRSRFRQRSTSFLASLPFTTNMGACLASTYLSPVAGSIAASNGDDRLGPVGLPGDSESLFARDLQERLGILALCALSAPFRMCNLLIPLATRETDPVSGHHLPIPAHLIQSQMANNSLEPSQTRLCAVRE
jgi:hypothetical protein